MTDEKLKKLKPSEVTEEGWYWFSESRGKYVWQEVAHVTRGTDGLLYLGSVYGDGTCKVPNDCADTDRFIGPLVVPELEEEK